MDPSLGAVNSNTTSPLLLPWRLKTLLCWPLPHKKPCPYVRFIDFWMSHNGPYPFLRGNERGLPRPCHHRHDKFEDKTHRHPTPLHLRPRQARRPLRHFVLQTRYVCMHSHQTLSYFICSPPQVRSTRYLLFNMSSLSCMECWYPRHLRGPLHTLIFLILLSLLTMKIPDNVSLDPKWYAEACRSKSSLVRLNWIVYLD